MKRIEPEFEQPELDGVEAAIFPIKQAQAHPSDYERLTLVLDRPRTNVRVSPLRAGQRVMIRFAVPLTGSTHIITCSGLIEKVGEGIVDVWGPSVWHVFEAVPWSAGGIGEMMRLASDPVPWRVAWPIIPTYS